jgi:hypothetical protein
MTIVKKPMPKDNCGCGKPVKITERKILRRIIKKR